MKKLDRFFLNWKPEVSTVKEKKITTVTEEQEHLLKVVVAGIFVRAKGIKKTAKKLSLNVSQKLNKTVKDISKKS